MVEQVRGAKAASARGISVPVGTVMPYAGRLNNNQLKARGWSICDGEELNVSDFPALFGAIGTSSGGNGNKTFRLPDLRGFFLRGRDPKGLVDPDAAARLAAASGGASGTSAGSVQPWATALPVTPGKSFCASLSHVTATDHNAALGCTADMLRYGGTQTFNATAGGDGETRPLNAYVNFIIQLVPGALLPAGVLVPFAGQGSSTRLVASYLLCDGKALDATPHAALFAAIGTAHGGNASTFNLPDYRGRFLRGVDNGKGKDPGAAARTAMAAGGATGDAVGSVQGSATGLPIVPFTLSFPLGSSDFLSATVAGYDDSRWNQGAVTVDFTAIGGDLETRPVNLCMDFYVLAQDDDGSSDMFPIGGVMAFAGNTRPPMDQWMLCDGATLQNAQQFTALYDAIQTSNGGGQAGSFRLPNLQGYFLRGRDRGCGRDPEAATRHAAAPGGAAGDCVGSLQGYATRKPDTPITGDIPHLPLQDDVNAALGGATATEWNGAMMVTTGGGDKESRPVNLYVDFYIKYAPAGRA
jgi:microcystin-dependent protein